MERIINKNKLKRKKLAGFSMLEMLVAIFIFAMILTVTISAFIASYKGQRKSKEMQQIIEDSRGAMELMAKNIRMGAIDSSNGTSDEIAFYNYSQNKCIKYKFSGNKIQAGEISIDRASLDLVHNDNCSTRSYDDRMYDLIADAVVENLNFKIVKSDYAVFPPVVGRITISIKIKNSEEPIQTTVSLRDYIE